MKYLIFYLSTFSMMGSSFSQSNLPPCQGSDATKWDNCSVTSTWPSGEKYIEEFKDRKLKANAAVDNQSTNSKIIIKINEEDSGTEFKVLINDKTLDLSYKKPLILDALLSSTIIKFFKKGDDSLKKPIYEFNLTQLNNSSSELLVYTSYKFLSTSISSITFSRKDLNGKIINKDPLSVDVDEKYQINHKEKATKYIQQQIKVINERVIEAKNLPKIPHPKDDWYILNFSDLGINADLRRKPSGYCQFLLFSPHINEAFYNNFLNVAKVVHQQPCKEVFVDITGPGGSVDFGLKIGIYIRQSGWSTTTGGWGLAQDDPLRTCSSSCANIFIAGIKRYYPSGLRTPMGIHQAAVENNSVKTCLDEKDLQSEMLRVYFSYMLGKDGEDIFNELISIDCKKVRFITNLSKNNIVTENARVSKLLDALPSN